MIRIDWQILVLDEELQAKRDELASMAAGLEEALRRPTPHAMAALAVTALRSAMHPVAAEALYRGRAEPEPVRPARHAGTESAVSDMVKCFL